jgi:predicted phage baseplate assembly protein
MTQACDCCVGPHVATPETIFNRPGLGALAWRAGTYGTFRETMQARLSSAAFPALAGFKSRAADDPSMALIDAWAVVGDVLTFYQERIANEGYLRTATERLSVLNLARLVGYTPRPGVAASVHLAYLLDKDAAPVEIPQGAKSNTIPGPGEQMQAFETSEPLQARAAWNMLQPRLTEPAHAIPRDGDMFYLKGVATGLKPNDPLLIGCAGQDNWQLHFIAAVEPDNDKDRTRIVLRGAPVPVPAPAAIAAATAGTINGVPAPAPASHSDCCVPLRPATAPPGGIVGALALPASLAPASARQLPRSIHAALAAGADALPNLLASAKPALADTLYAALRNAPPTAVSTLEVHALRVEARPFGYNAPLRQSAFDATTGRSTLSEWSTADSWNFRNAANPTTVAPESDYQQPSKLFLDNEYNIAPDSFVVIEKQAASQVIVTQAAKMIHRSLTAYGLSGKTVELDLPAKGVWLASAEEPFATVRTTRIFTGSEKLELAETPIPGCVGGGEIELDGLYDGLQAGRWLIVTGERRDVGAVKAVAAIPAFESQIADVPSRPAVDGVQGVPGIPGVKAAELVMIAGVTQRIRAETSCGPTGETVHSFITLATDLAYSYRRETVAIYGNVIHATHGETRQETLGAGDASRALQTFDLKQAPLTFVSAPSVAGIASTLQVRVNDVQWHETGAMAPLGPKDRSFVTRTDDDDKVSLVFGDGVHGARLPTGVENVKAIYRSGIGKEGNAKAGQITLLNTRPLGVKDVVNPIRASGGADRETRDQARQNTPLALLALDRLVAVQDYADFSRTFAGIGKATARRITDGRRQLVEVTIAGVEDIPIETTSDLYRNLLDALHRFGDPYLPIRLTLRSRSALAISANVKVDPDYQWETLEPKIRAALLARFAFARMALGGPAFLSDAFATIQSVPGVVYADLDVFDKVTDDALIGQFTGKPAVTLGRNDILCAAPGEIAYLVPDVPDTLILQEIKP